MKNHPGQISLLEAFETQNVFDAANDLIDMLNDGRSKKDIYYAQGHFEDYGYHVFIAKNKSGDVLFNCLDSNGKIPEGFNACWRGIEHVAVEIHSKIEK